MRKADDRIEPSFTFRFLTTLLLSGLLMEWLILWLHAGEWSFLLQPATLIWMTGIMLSIGLLKPRPFWLVIAGVVICLVGLYVLHRNEGEHIFEWLIRLIPSMAYNFNEMLNYGIWYMSDEIRTLLLFAGWLLLAPSLQAMIWQYQLSLSFVAATIMYLLFFHTMLGLNIWPALLRVIGEGLLLTAITTQYKLRQDHQAELFRGMNYRHYAIGMITLAALVVASGVLASDNKEKQSKPIAWSDILSSSVAEELAAWNQQTGGMPLKHVTSSSYRSPEMAIAGYDQDDSLLGQTLQQNDEVVFFAWSPQKGYWRGETKAVYTGKGWEDFNGAIALHKVADSTKEALAELGNKGKGESVVQTITYIEPAIGMPLLQSGTKGIVLSLQASNPERQLSSYISEPATGALYPPTTDAEIKSYTLLTELPYIDAELLQEVAETDEQLAQKMWEADVLREYLQLPEELPERVAALAAEVSGGGWTSRYNQVKAIEQFLQNNYRYSLKSKPADDGEDFVDHFLFEQQQGYCVHFATAMVIMLRTQDIPARWVKGYQSGEAVAERTTEDGIVETQYKVRAQDAHAWVEVYFPEVGWVPFDPTPASRLQSEQAVAWLHNMKQIGRDVISQLQTWSSNVSIFGFSIAGLSITQWSVSQWLWFTAAGVLLVSILIAFLMSLPLLKTRQLIRGYEACYRAYMPLRSRQRSITRMKAQVKQIRLQQKQQRQIYALADYCLGQLEKKMITRDATFEKSTSWREQTWRERILALAIYQDAVKREQLHCLLEVLERIQYSSELSMPDPAELKRMIAALSPFSIGRRVRTRNRNRQKTVDRAAQESHSLERHSAVQHENQSQV